MFIFKRFRSSLPKNKQRAEPNIRDSIQAEQNSQSVLLDHSQPYNDTIQTEPDEDRIIPEIVQPIHHEQPQSFNLFYKRKGKQQLQVGYIKNRRSLIEDIIDKKSFISKQENLIGIEPEAEPYGIQQSGFNILDDEHTGSERISNPWMSIEPRPRSIILDLPKKFSPPKIITQKKRFRAIVAPSQSEAPKTTQLSRQTSPIKLSPAPKTEESPFLKARKSPEIIITNRKQRYFFPDTGSNSQDQLRNLSQDQAPSQLSQCQLAKRSQSNEKHNIQQYKNQNIRFEQRKAISTGSPLSPLLQRNNKDKLAPIKPKSSQNRVDQSKSQLNLSAQHIENGSIRKIEQKELNNSPKTPQEVKFSESLKQFKRTSTDNNALKIKFESLNQQQQYQNQANPAKQESLNENNYMPPIRGAKSSLQMPFFQDKKSLKKRKSSRQPLQMGLLG